jgi:hypothetical protein
MSRVGSIDHADNADFIVVSLMAGPAKFGMGSNWEAPW